MRHSSSTDTCAIRWRWRRLLFQARSSGLAAISASASARWNGRRPAAGVLRGAPEPVAGASGNERRDSSSEHTKSCARARCERTGIRTSHRMRRYGRPWDTAGKVRDLAHHLRRSRGAADHRVGDPRGFDMEPGCARPRSSGSGSDPPPGRPARSPAGDLGRAVALRRRQPVVSKSITATASMPAPPVYCGHACRRQTSQSSQGRRSHTRGNATKRLPTCTFAPRHRQARLASTPPRRAASAATREHGGSRPPSMYQRLRAASQRAPSFSPGPFRRRAPSGRVAWGSPGGKLEVRHRPPRDASGASALRTVDAKSPFMDQGA